MSRKVSLADTISTGEVSASSLSTLTTTCGSSSAAPRTQPAQPQPTASQAAAGTTNSLVARSPDVPIAGPTLVEKQLFRRGALPPPVDGVVGVVVRVRPLSTKELADPSVKTCVQCLKDSVIVGGACAARSGSVSSLPRGGASDDVDASAFGGSRRAPPIIKTRSDVNRTTPSATRKSTSTAGATRRQQFRADQVFHQCTSQVDVYEQACRHVVEGVYQGINGAILAYGATGSGKTHTMFGGPLSAAGVVYQAVRDIFDEKTRLEEEEDKRVTVKCSFVEIYNEDVFDLLAPTSSSSSTGGSTGHGKHLVNGRPALQVRDAGTTASSSTAGSGAAPRASAGGAGDKKKAKPGVDKDVNPESLVISGLTYAYPTSLSEFTSVIEHGHTNRFTAATGANAHSSRSHAIITVEVQVVEAGQKGSGGGTVARIRFCDLAGSERAAATSNTGVRLREGGNINRSLLALGAVVQALAQRARFPQRNIFVPYRGSKLTRLLRDGLGGNCRTQMLFCLSPSAHQYEESVNTMLFAMQAKEIRVAAKRNEYQVNSVQVTKNQEEIIDELRADLAAARDELCRLRGWPTDDEHRSLSRCASVQRLLWNQDTPPTVVANVNGAVTDSARASTAKTLPVLARPTATASPPPNSATVSAYSNFPTVSDLSVRLPTATTMNDGRDGSRCPSCHPHVLGTPISPCAGQPVEEGGVGSSAAASGNKAAMAMTTALTASYGRGRSVTPSPGQGYAGRPSVFQDSANLFSELEAKFKAFTEEKKALYHAMRDTQEQHAQRDVELRDAKWRLARFLASGALGNLQRGGPDARAETTSGGTVVTPVGVAGLRQLIGDMERTNAQEDTHMEELESQMNDVDRRIADSRRELLQEKQYTALELLLDNANLRQNGTEAESLAAHYHQQWHSALKRQEEYAQALEAATEALRGALQLLPADSQAAEQARLALVYAELPTTTTSEMIPVFERALKRQRPQPLHDGAKSVSILVPPSDSHTATLSPTGEGCRGRGGGGGAAGPLGMPPLPVSHGLVRTPSSSASLQGPAAPPMPTGSTTEAHSSARHPPGTRDGTTGDLEQQYQQLVDAANHFREGGLPDGVVARGRRGSHSGQPPTTTEVAASHAPVPLREPAGIAGPRTERDSPDVGEPAKPARDPAVAFDLPGGATAKASSAEATSEPTSTAREGRKGKRTAVFSRSYSTSALQRGGGGDKKKKAVSRRAASPTTEGPKKVRARKSTAGGKARMATDSGATAGGPAGPAASAACEKPLARRASAPAFTFADHSATRTRVARVHSSSGAAKACKDDPDSSDTTPLASTRGEVPARFRRTTTDTAKLSASPMTKLTAPSPERADPPSSASPRDRAVVPATPVRENAASKLRQAAVLLAAQRNNDPYLPTAASPTRRDTEKASRKTRKTKKSTGLSPTSCAGGKQSPKPPRDLTPASAGTAPRRARSAFSRSQTAVTVSPSRMTPSHGDARDAAHASPFRRRASSSGRAEAERRVHEQQAHLEALYTMHENILGGHQTPNRSRSAHERRCGGQAGGGGVNRDTLKERNLSAQSSTTGEEGLTDRPSS